MISDRLISLVQCPECSGELRWSAPVASCSSCGRTYSGAQGYLDLRPATAFDETTKYTDGALHADARHETVSPPLLSAGIRQWMLRRFLAAAAGDRVIDLGCGSGRSLVWNAIAGAHLVGIDAAPYFAAEALERYDVVLGDLRRLPFASGAFTKAYMLDVLEHLSRDALHDVLRETARVMAPGGRVFAYSHVRKNAPIARGLRAINKLAERLERAGWIDLRQEHLRKSDHLNPLADIPDLERVVEDAGFRVARIRYYTPLVGAVIENILMRVAEQALARRARTRNPESKEMDQDAASALKAARLSAKARLARKGPTYGAVQAATWLMRVDIALFGRVRTGPFFVLLEKQAAR